MYTVAYRGGGGQGHATPGPLPLFWYTMLLMLNGMTHESQSRKLLYKKTIKLVKGDGKVHQEEGRQKISALCAIVLHTSGQGRN
jgi:hypothetical protein